MTSALGFGSDEFAKANSFQVAQLCVNHCSKGTTSEVKTKLARTNSVGEETFAYLCKCLMLAARYDNFLTDICLARVEFAELSNFIATMKQATAVDNRLAAANLVYALRRDNKQMNIKAPVKCLSSLQAEIFRTEVELDPVLLLLTAIFHSRHGDIESVSSHYWKSVQSFGQNSDIYLSTLFTCGEDDVRRLSAILYPSDANENNMIYQAGKENRAFEPGVESDVEGTTLSGQDRASWKLDFQRATNEALYYLKGLDSGLLSVTHESLKSILNCHFRAKNYYGCLQLILKQIGSVTEEFVRDLDPALLKEVHLQCKNISINIRQKLHNVRSSVNTDLLPDMFPCKEYSARLLELSRLACLLQPDDRQSLELLCDACRCAGDLENASKIAARFLAVDDWPKMLVLYMHCQIDKNNHTNLLAFLENRNQGMQAKACECAFRAILKIILGDISAGVSIIQELISSSKAGARETLEIILRDMEDRNMTAVCAKLYEFAHTLYSQLPYEIPLDDLDKKSAIAILASLSELLCNVKPKELEYSFLRANVLQATGDFEGAQQKLVSTIVKHPTDHSPMVCLANLRLKQGSYVAAVEDFQILVRMLGSAKLEEGFSRLPLSDRLEIGRVLRAHAFKYLTKDRAYTAAIDCLSVAICAVGSKASGLVLARAFCYMHTSDFLGALNDFNCVLSYRPTLTSALCGRAVLKAVTTRVDDAIRDFEEAFRIDRDSCQACLAKIPLEHVETFAQLVAQIIEQTVELHCEAKRRNEVVSTSSSMEQLNLSLMYVKFLACLFPTSVPLKCLQSRVLFAQGDSVSALRDIRQSLVEFPADHSLLVWHGVLLTSSKKYSEAISALRSVRDFTQSKEVFMRYLRTCEVERLSQHALQKALDSKEEGDMEHAIRLCNLCLLFYPQNIDAIRLRMDCYAQSGDPRRSMEDLNIIIHLEPTVKDLCLRARSRYVANSFRDACIDYFAAFELDSSDAIRHILADVGREEALDMLLDTAEKQLASGDYQSLVRLCEFGLQLDKGNKALRDLRQRAHKFQGKCSLQ